MRLFRLELKKIMKTRRTWVMIAAALFLSVGMAWLPVTFEAVNVYDEAGNRIKGLEGIEAIAYLKDLQKEITGVVTPDKIKTALREYQACLREYGVEGTYDLPEGVYERRILPYRAIMHGIKEAFANRDNGMARDYMEIDPEWGENYYQACEERLISLMEMEQKNNQAAQSAALKMYQAVEKPYVYYPGYNSNATEYEGFLIMMLLLLAICIAAPVFSTDYQTGADDILRCTKHGRIRLGIVKLTAVAGITGVLFVICITIHLLLVNSFFGWECLKTSLQIEWSATTLSNWNMGQFQLAIALAGFLSFIASICFTLFVSSRCQNVVSSMAISYIVCLAPLFSYLMFGGISVLEVWLACILPSGGICVPSGFLYEVLDFKFLKVGNFAIWEPYAMLCFAGVEIVFFAVLAVCSYVRKKG